MTTKPTAAPPGDRNAIPREPVHLPIDEIVVDLSISARLKQYASVRQLARLLAQGTELPPVDVFDINGEWYLADGFQRFEALRSAGVTTIAAYIVPGSRSDATIHAIKVNARHGRRLTSVEKRRAVTKLLDNPEWALRSDREIAEICGCSPPTVASERKKHPLTDKFGTDHVRVVRNRHGGHSPMTIDNHRRSSAIVGDAATAVGSPSGSASLSPQASDGPAAPVLTLAEGSAEDDHWGMAVPDEYLDAVYWMEEATAHLGDPTVAGHFFSASAKTEGHERLWVIIDWFAEFAEAIAGSSVAINRQPGEADDDC